MESAQGGAAPAELLSSLLGNPAVAERLREMAASLSSGEDSGGTIAPGIASLLGNPALMEKLPHMLSAVKPMLSASSDSPPREASPEQRREALLLALKPFLSPERQRAVDTLLQVSHMGLLLKNLK